MGPDGGAQKEAWMGRSRPGGVGWGGVTGAGCCGGWDPLDQVGVGWGGDWGGGGMGFGEEGGVGVGVGAGAWARGKGQEFEFGFGPWFRFGFRSGSEYRWGLGWGVVGGGTRIGRS